MSKSLLVQANGVAIRKHRADKGWTREDLWNKTLGISLRTIQRAEEDESVKRKTLEAIAKALNVDCEGLIRKNPHPRVRFFFSGLMSGSLAYTRNIWLSFSATLENYARSQNLRLYFTDATGTDPSLKDLSIEGSWDVPCRILTQCSPDQFVTIGTQASKALYKHLGPAYGQKPFLFLGVTDPEDTGLVGSLEHRDERIDVCGVTYGPGAGKIVDQLDQLFPTRQLIYIYRKEIQQDEAVARALKATRFYDRGRLLIRPIDGQPTIDDMPEKEPVYFSWYTFESLLEEAQGLEIASQRILVSNNCQNVVRSNCAVVSLGPNTTELGRLGAAIVIKRLKGDINYYGEVDITVPKSYHWINLATAKKFGIEFSNESILEASDVFGLE